MGNASAFALNTCLRAAEDTGLTGGISVPVITDAWVDEACNASGTPRTTTPNAFPALPPSASPTVDGALCDDTCEYAEDGSCDDVDESGKHTHEAFCNRGTDCTDCGVRDPTPTHVPTRSATTPTTFPASDVPLEAAMTWYIVVSCGLGAAFVISFIAAIVRFRRYWQGQEESSAKDDVQLNNRRDVPLGDG